MNEFIAPQFPSFERTGVAGPWPQAASMIQIDRVCGDEFVVCWFLNGHVVAETTKCLEIGDSVCVNTRLMPS